MNWRDREKILCTLNVHDGCGDDEELLYFIYMFLKKIRAFFKQSNILVACFEKKKIKIFSSFFLHITQSGGFFEEKSELKFPE